MLDPHTAVARVEGRSPLPKSSLIEAVMNDPLPVQFHDWLVLKGVRAVEGQDGPWRTVGQRRVLRMTDGSVTQEELVGFDPEAGWTNVLSGFTNGSRRIVTRIEDDWAFADDPRGTAVTWTWTFHPRPTLVGRVLAHGMAAPLHRVYLHRILQRTLSRIEAEHGRASRVEEFRQS